MAFDRYVRIDYSGAETPSSSLRGLRMYIADRASMPVEVPPPLGPKWYWTRRGIAERLVEMFTEGTPTLVGIDHGFSFPLRYFEKYDLPLDWGAFLDDFQLHWPTDNEYTYVESVREGKSGKGAARMGRSTWRRIKEVRARGAKLFFILMCRARLRSLLTADCRGCVISDRARTYIFGRLMVGKFRPGDRRWPRCIRPCGASCSRRRVAIGTSRTHTPLRRGCVMRI